MKSLDKVWIEKTGIKSPNTGMETLIIHNAIKIEKSLDKKKTKELDWEKEFEKAVKLFLTATKRHYVVASVYGYLTDFISGKEFKKVISSLLDKQRTELLKEINKLPDLTTTEFGEETISRLEVISLVKK